MKIKILLANLMMIFIFQNASAQQGQTLNFSNGANTNVSLANNIQLLDSFTIETWIFPELKGDFATIIGNKSPGIASPGYFLAINSYASNDGRIIFETQNATNASVNSVTWNQWQHIAITWNGNQVRMYINGVWQALNDSSYMNLQNSSSPCYLGDIPAYIGNGNFLGNMDELRVWNHARTQQEIIDNMYCQLGNNELGLTAYFQFNEGIANGSNVGVNTLPDLSGNSHTGTLNNFGLNGNVTNWLAPGAVNAIAATQSIETCDGNAITIGSNVYTTNGTYVDTLVSSNGCDSVVTTNLIFNTINTINQTFDICNGDSVVVGDSTYYSAGIFTNNFLNIFGCDSIIQTTINVTIPNTSVTQIGNTLVAEPGATAYQWIICDSLNSLIPNETNQNFSPFVDGTYAVIVNNAGCSAVSNCFPIILTGLTQSKNLNLNISPNPAHDFITFSLTKNKGYYQVLSIDGLLVLEGNLLSENPQIDISKLNAGMYFISDCSGKRGSFIKN